MEFVQVEEPDLRKPILIAAMQDMGNVGSTAIDLINDNLNTRLFRYVSSSYPPFVVDKGGYIEYYQEKWEYRYGKDIIVFGGGKGQPENNEDLYKLCQDVIDVAKRYEVRLVYTLGAFQTDQVLGKNPKTFVTTTSQELTSQVSKIGVDITPQQSLITGFNGLILGFAKSSDLQGIGLYGEINDPQIPQYRAVKSILQTLERLTYQKFGDFIDLDLMADAVDNEVHK